jgi:hypothetical protein
MSIFELLSLDPTGDLESTVLDTVYSLLDPFVSKREYDTKSWIGIIIYCRGDLTPPCSSAYIVGDSDLSYKSTLRDSFDKD